MGILSNIFQASGPTNSIADLSNPVTWLLSGAGFGARTVSGENVSPESALRLGVYFACIRNIGEDVGKTDRHVYKKNKDGSVVVDEEHPVEQLVSSNPNPDMTNMTFFETLAHQAPGWGNAYAEIARDDQGVARELWPIHPSRVYPARKNGKLVYMVRMHDTLPSIAGTPQVAQEVELPAEDVLHVRGPGSNGITGYSVAKLAAETLGLGIALRKYGASFFGNGGVPSGVITVKRNLSKEAMQNIRESWNELYGGGATKGNRPAFLQEHMEYTPITVPPEDSQFIQSQQFNVEEIARWFRMPPHKIQHLLRSTFNNIEHQNTEYTTDTLQPWMTRHEQETTLKLLSEKDRADGRCIKHDMKALMRGDTKTRTAFYKDMFNTGSMNSNEIRREEGMNPREGGETFYRSGNLIAATGDEDATTQATGNARPGGEDNEPNERLRQQAVKMLAGGVSKLIEIETKKFNSLKNFDASTRFEKWAAFFGGQHQSRAYDILKERTETVSAMYDADIDCTGLATVFTAEHTAAARAGDQPTAEEQALGFMIAIEKEMKK